MENKEQEINLSLTLNEVNIILNGLGEMPAKASMNIIHKIQVQAGPQISVENEKEGA